MSDLVSREAVIQICRNAVPDTNPNHYDMESREGYGSWMHSNGEECVATRIQVKVEKLHAVDAASVVHCKDCINHRTYECSCVSENSPDHPSDDWFCADGERSITDG